MTDIDKKETTSRLEMWWLTLFKGYTIRCIRQRPRQAMLGFIAYTTLWKLEKAGK